MCENLILWSKNNLPTWKNCRSIIENDEYRVKNHKIRVVDEDPVPTHLHKFIYENEPSDPIECYFFRDILIKLLNEVPHLYSHHGQIFDLMGIINDSDSD